MLGFNNLMTSDGEIGCREDPFILIDAITGFRTYTTCRDGSVSLVDQVIMDEIITMLNDPPGSLWAVERDCEEDVTALPKNDLPFPSWCKVEFSGPRVTHPLNPDYWLDLSGRRPRWTSEKTDKPIELA